MQMLSGLSIVVPVLNEEATLREVTTDLLRVAPTLAGVWEVILVNDGSTDRSGEIGRDLARQHSAVRLIEHPANRGFGAAQRTGFAACRFDYVTAVPADGQFDAADLRRLVEAIDDCDLVLGIRGARDDSAYRKLKTAVFRWVLRRWLDIAMHDVNWVKLYRRRVFDLIEIESDGIGIETEIICKARDLGLRMKEVPVGYLPRRAGQAKGDQWRNVLITIAELLRLRRRQDATAAAPQAGNVAS